jgi:hypothetical protein
MFSPAQTVPTNTEHAQEAEPKSLGGLYEHKSRSEWGLATRVAAEDGRVSYQFQDGKLRKIDESFSHLLREVERPLCESVELQQALAAMAGVSLAKKGSRSAGHQLITVAQQVGLFLEDFSDGFASPAYIKKHRGTGKRATRHRDPAVAQAKELFGQSELQTLVAGSQHHVVMGRVVTLLSATSLVTDRQLEPVKALDEIGNRRSATALYELLYGEEDRSTAMQSWIDGLASAGRGVSWPLATAVAALVEPLEHFCVQPTVLSHQVRGIGLGLEIKTTPSGRLYQRLVAMARSLHEELLSREMSPRDLLDVFDFVALTLRPAARKRISQQLATASAMNEISVAASAEEDSAASAGSKTV